MVDLLQKRAVRVIDREIGYFRSDVAVLLSGAAWAFFALIQLSKSSLNKTFLVLSKHGLRTGYRTDRQSASAWVAGWGWHSFWPGTAGANSCSSRRCWL